MKRLFTLLAFAIAAMGQDCAYPFTFTVAQPFAYQDNRQSACTYWQMSYQSSGFTAVSLQFEYASGAAAPGAFAVFNGTLLTGANPSSNTAGTSASFQGYIGWYRMNAVTLTGTGTLTGVLYGWKYQPVTAVLGGGNSNPATGPSTISAVGALIPPQPANWIVEHHFGNNANCYLRFDNGYGAARTNPGQFQAIQFWLYQTNTSGCSGANGVLIACDVNTPLPAGYPWTVILGLAPTQSTDSTQFGAALAKVGSGTYESIPVNMGGTPNMLQGRYNDPWTAGFGSGGSFLPVSAGNNMVPWPYLFYVIHDNGVKRCWAEMSYNPGSVFGMPIQPGETSGWCTGSGSSGVVDGFYVGQANVTSNFVPDHLCVYAENVNGSYGSGFSIISEQILGQ